MAGRNLSLFPADVLKKLSRKIDRAKPKLFICPICKQVFRRRSGECGCSLRCMLTVRFWKKVQKTAGCWYWLGGKTLGYGRITHSPLGLSWMAHRFSYELHFGSIPEDLVLDHLCRTPSCVNPYHLQAVSPQENTRRGQGPAANNARKTHCKHGHPFDEANTIIRKTGYRQCRTCRDADTKARDALKRQERQRIRLEKFAKVAERAHQRRGHRPIPLECLYGHAYTFENTSFDLDGGVRCRTCGRLDQRQRDARKLSDGRHTDTCTPSPASC